jgi:hypothetical protein
MNSPFFSLFSVVRLSPFLVISYSTPPESMNSLSLLFHCAGGVNSMCILQLEHDPLSRGIRSAFSFDAPTMCMFIPSKIGVSHADALLQASSFQANLSSLLT